MATVEGLDPTGRDAAVSAATGTPRRRLVDDAARLLADAGVASPSSDAELLLAFVCDVPRGQLVTITAVASTQAARYQALVARRAAREPLQHLTGRAPFRHIDVEVGPGVFVPRPETEAMVSWVVEQVRTAGTPAVVLELCAGSGAISVALADEVPASHLYAVELDPPAFAYLERNLAGTFADARLGDMADAPVIWPALVGRCDVVVANPPYIPMDAYESVPPEVRDHDPALALWSGDDGLEATRAVAEVAARMLRHGGVVASEHAEVQAASAPQLFARHGAFDQVRDNPDLTGRARFVTARRV